MATGTHDESETTDEEAASAKGASAEPDAILVRTFQRASASLSNSLITDTAVRAQIEFICRSWNRAATRFVLACALARASYPHLDIRKPYTEIGSSDAYSGRQFDERYIDAFIKQHDLPVNMTTAFLTPAFRTKNIVLTPDVHLGGQPARLYTTAVELINEVYVGNLSADDLLAEAIRMLITIREENRIRLESSLADLAANTGSLALSSEDIITLIQQHLASPRASRLPVLAIAAAYTATSNYLGEQALPLQAHHAADIQTGSLGDVEITVLGGDADAVVTVYEMKDKQVTRINIVNGLTKVQAFYQTHGRRVQNYIFITTDVIEKEVQDYARSLYEKTGGVEFVIPDCIGFMRHFLHLFHRSRMLFLEAYQALVLQDSAVGQPLKESFLALRRAAESQLAEGMENEL